MLAHLATWILKLFGWTVHADYPDTGKYVVIAAPHTSNWDFPLGILAGWAMQLQVHFIGKHTLFYWPWGWLFRALGGEPVKRGHSANLIKHVAAMFEHSDKLVFALAPEGTRSKTDHWKTGFYYIARAARVPIVMGYLDFGHKQVGIGGAFFPGGDIEADFSRIRAFYANRQGKCPAKASQIQVKREREKGRNSSSL